ncbi:MAG: pantoate--beta-alanine ligase [Planctomycetaceae bacterium]|nr:pantoate--beta-alanine ligase [Planctomycetaceae bacterium]
MQTTDTIAETRQLVQHARRAGNTIGCVPTMGALHTGHLSLIERARAETDFVVVTLFVNPTQFGPHEDFAKYPRPLENDLRLCQSAGADLVFCPEVAEIYGADPQVSVRVGDLATCWEGSSRPGHFDGVATIVLKLFNIIQPDRAFFGAKDYQQQVIIKVMCGDLNLPVEIVTCPTVRAEDGLALSSRNVYLSSEERQIALRLNHALTFTRELILAGELTMSEIREQFQNLLRGQPGLQLDYATIVDPRMLTEVADYQPRMVLLVAAKVGNTRLIDNLEVVGSVS